MQIKGIVVRGKQEATKLGYPTANIEYVSEAKIEAGVWSCWLDIDGVRHQAAGVVGMWTLTNGCPSVEAHILDFSEDLYGRTVEVIFGERLRPLQQFISVDVLKQQIAEDVTNIRKWFITH